MLSIEVESIEYIPPNSKECIVCGSKSDLKRINGIFICKRGH